MEFDRMSANSPARPRYSPARRVPLGASGDLLFLSGVVCHDEDARDNIEIQTRRIFARIAQVLEEHGAALTSIIKTTSFLVDLADYDCFNRVRVETFKDCREPPASTAVGAGSLLGQGTRLEVEVVALVRPY
ncbi:RidA family protein [Bradyrhizobium sp. AZCC 2262]|uniref:RidA family protein n=1 Tax=Bradyrhizobium sp. AZCC 2262 TaxID=3117022 RepID=UPI002FF1E215